MRMEPGNGSPAAQRHKGKGPSAGAAGPGGETVSACRGCGAQIDWITTREGKYMPVDPEPVLVAEGGGTDRYVTGEGAVILGRPALPGDKRPGLEAAFVPHWKTCRASGRFRRDRRAL